MATTQPALPTLDDVLGYVRAWASAEHARDYRRAQYYKTLLLETIALAPDWALPPVVMPAAEIERKLKCENTLTLRNDDGCIVLVVSDGVEAMAPALTEDEAVQMRSDLARVLAAMGGER
jgi:hypothetical protein